MEKEVAGKVREGGENISCVSDGGGGGISRVELEARANRELATRKRAEAQRARDEARRQQMEEESMERKAEKAELRCEELRRGQAEAVQRIEGYNRHIENCTAEMSEFKFLIIFIILIERS